jgi:hypothetical protein
MPMPTCLITVLVVCLSSPAGPAPIYIGFGSLVVGDPAKLTKQFMDAIQHTGLRAIIQRGWGGLGAGIKPGQVRLTAAMGSL